MIRIKATIKIPNHGRKNGKKAIELKRVASIKFKLVKLKIYNRTIDIMKCSIAINRVAWIRFVIDDMSYCLCSENKSFSTPEEEWKYWVVK